MAAPCHNSWSDACDPSVDLKLIEHQVPSRLNDAPPSSKPGICLADGDQPLWPTELDVAPQKSRESEATEEHCEIIHGPSSPEIIGTMSRFSETDRIGRHQVGSEDVADMQTMQCSNLQSLLQQVELEHLREIAIVRAELELQCEELERELKALRPSTDDTGSSRAQDFKQDDVFQRGDDYQSKKPFMPKIDEHGQDGTQSSDTNWVVHDRSKNLAEKDETNSVARKSSQSSSRRDLTALFRGRSRSRAVMGNSSTQSARFGRIISLWELGEMQAQIFGSRPSRKDRASRLSSSFAIAFSSEGYEPITGIGRLARNIVDSSAFEVACAAAIVLSGALVGISTHMAAQNGDPFEMPSSVTYAELGITCWFLLECCLRLGTEGCLRFFFGPQRAWNNFDFVVVAMDVLNLCYSYFLNQVDQGASQANSKQQMSATRVVRVMRLARTLRAIRLFRFFSQLRKMVFSIMRSGLPLLWSMILLGIIIFMFSIYFCQNVTFYVYMHKDDGGETVESLQKMFGSLIYTEYILFQCIAGGMSWGEVGELLMEVHWSNCMVLSFFAFFNLFAVLNMITGIFVDGALTSAQERREEKINEALSSEHSTVVELGEILGAADTNHNGALTLAEIAEQFRKPKVRAQAKLLGIDSADAKSIFKLLDTDHTGEVRIEEFIIGCLKMKGNAKSIDLIIVMNEQRRLRETVKNFFDKADKKINQKLELQSDALAKIYQQQLRTERGVRLWQGQSPQMTQPPIGKSKQWHWQSNGDQSASSLDRRAISAQEEQLPINLKVQM